MKYKLIDQIENEGYRWEVYEVSEGVFWESRCVETGQSFLFHRLPDLRQFIEEAERLTNRRSLFQSYVDANLAVSSD